jgi:mannose-1-phosphate guanylyltransferase
MAIQVRRENLWAIVLAGGEGARLSTLTRALHGWNMPKQFAALWGGRTLLARTLDRTRSMVPPQRTIVVVPDDYRALAHEQLRDYPGIQVVFQPCNRGTAAGVLLSLAHVMANDPAATVVIFPSDHHVDREIHFRDAVRRAIVAANFAPSQVALVGAASESPATDLGWIDCGRSLGSSTAGAYEVKAFVEKPSSALALDLLRQGALWNTMVIAARGQSLWAMADRHIPEVSWCFMTYQALLGSRQADSFVRGIYPGLPSTDFCRDILQRAKGLTAVAMTDAGWSDCGTPERLFRAMEPSREGIRLLARIERQDPFFDEFATVARRELETRRAN